MDGAKTSSTDITMSFRRLIDYDRCIGCGVCEEVCSFLHEGRPRIFLYRITGGIDRPISCFHCAKAPCVAVCPTNALSYDGQGAVTVSITKCIGCTSCIAACPFGIPELLPIGHIAKCDLCKKLRIENLEPGCIATCPSNAILWGSPESIAKAMREKSLKRIIKAYSLHI
ncbi:MAG: 4Fe-4S dicluster domain-containing protein [Ignisphaera sp.]|nr:4Fe-4S dicluster domain-containing protein [Ignisphaera sp.]MCX8168295.1 4Fe-4S dicluster domain-containing protein [Ignisphaera sp.]MDW8085885.1 4Fe-4S dicluster domain-containing protein [Ignisphaera sp.]